MAAESDSKLRSVLSASPFFFLPLIRTRYLSSPAPFSILFADSPTTVASPTLTVMVTPSTSAGALASMAVEAWWDACRAGYQPRFGLDCCRRATGDRIMLLTPLLLA